MVSKTDILRESSKRTISYWLLFGFDVICERRGFIDSLGLGDRLRINMERKRKRQISYFSLALLCVGGFATHICTGYNFIQHLRG